MRKREPPGSDHDFRISCERDDPPFDSSDGSSFDGLKSSGELLQSCVSRKVRPYFALLKFRFFCDQIRESTATS